jgi:acetyl esterase/lipase
MERVERGCLAVDKRMKNFYQWISRALCAIGLFLSCWIILPAPTALFLLLSVGAPEVSCWLFGLNLLGGLLVIQEARKKLFSQIALVSSVIGIVLCLLPFSQLSTVNQQVKTSMTQSLGVDYLAKVPKELASQMRPQPFVVGDAFSGIQIEEVRYTSGIPFAQHNGVPLTLDIYRPAQVGLYPGVMVIHGGAWQGGDPTNNEEFNRYLAARGYVVWSISYRLAPSARFPAQIEDVRAALSFLRERATEYETKSDRIALLGRSAGAHLAMLAAYTPSAIKIRAVVDYYGPVDLAAGYNDPPNPDPINTQAVLETFLGGTPKDVPKLYEQASPVQFVKKSLPASLLIYGGRDNVVQSKYGRGLYERLKSEGNKVVFIELPWADHAFDTVLNGISGQFSLYYTERLLAWALYSN